MLRFLFSFCDTSDDATLVKPPGEEELAAAFKMTQKLANESNTLRDHLNLA